MISIIIPNYNGREILEKNLPSVLEAKKNKLNQIFEIIIVDDASKDNSVEYLQGKFGTEIVLIKHKKNRGFSSAINTGVRASKGDLICLLNTDVSVTSNFLVSPLKLLEKNQVAGVSFHEKGYGYAVGKFKDGYIVHDPGKEIDSIALTFWISGGSSVLKRKIYNELSGFDEKLYSPFYWEDVDMSYRMLKRGYELYWDPNSIVFHNHESTVMKINKRYRIRIQERNHLLFIWKNLTSKVLFAKHIKGLFLRLSRHPGYLLVVLMVIIKLPLVLKQRRKETKESKVSDEAIFNMFNK